MSQNLIASVKDDERISSALSVSLFAASFPTFGKLGRQRRRKVAENKSERGWVLMGGGYYRRRVHSHMLCSTSSRPLYFLLCECEGAYLKWMHCSPALHPFSVFLGQMYVLRADTSSFLLFATHAAHFYLSSCCLAQSLGAQCLEKSFAQVHFIYWAAFLCSRRFVFPVWFRNWVYGEKRARE